MTTTSEMRRETVRAARMTTELVTARAPSCAAEDCTVTGVTAPKYGLEHAGVDLRRFRRRDQQQDVAVVQRRVVLPELRDRVAQLRVCDVVAASRRDARVVEPD